MGAKYLFVLKLSLSSPVSSTSESNSMDLPALVTSIVNSIKPFEDDFETKNTVEEKIKFVNKVIENENIDVRNAVRKWRKEAQVHANYEKSKELREKGDKLYLEKKIENAYQTYR